MRLAVLGGSFNPVHLGHLALADAVLHAFSYDHVLLVPSFKNPFKEASEGASPQDRLEMLAAATLGDGRFGLEDCEIRRGGVSYMIDTVEHLMDRYRPEGKIGLILGDDLGESFPAWRGASALAGTTDIILGRRLLKAEPFAYPHRTLDNTVFQVSSSDLRRRIAAGEPWRYLVPFQVAALIEERGLYGHGSAGQAFRTASSRMVDIETFAFRRLSTERFLHSRNVAMQAEALAGRFGADQAGAYLAGISHDLCKDLPIADMMALALADGAGLSDLERRKPSLLHARAAARLLELHFGPMEPSIVEAVRLHTSGAPGMGVLAQIVYIADRIEPRRESVSPRLRDLASQADLQTLFRAVLFETADRLSRRGKTIAPGTEALMAQYGSREDV